MSNNHTDLKNANQGIKRCGGVEHVPEPKIQKVFIFDTKDSTDYYDENLEDTLNVGSGSCNAVSEEVRLFLNTVDNGDGGKEVFSEEMNVQEKMADNENLIEVNGLLQTVKKEKVEVPDEEEIALTDIEENRLLQNLKKEKLELADEEENALSDLEGSQLLATVKKEKIELSDEEETFPEQTPDSSCDALNLDDDEIFEYIKKEEMAIDYTDLCESGLVGKEKVEENQGKPHRVRSKLPRSSRTYAPQEILPDKSKKRYEAAYRVFTNWQRSNNKTSFSENDLLEYFAEYVTTYKPSTMWHHFSMLRGVVQVKKNVDIGDYKKLKAFLKNRSAGFTSKKSPVFTPEELRRFINEAPDGQYLAAKVIAIFGAAGATSGKDLVNLTVDDVEHHGSVIIVRTPDSQKSCTIEGKYADIVREYEALRPSYVCTNRYFVNYKDGACMKQAMGVNQFAIFPKKIATYLNLPEADRYTGLSFRRTSATFAEGCIERSASNKSKVSSGIWTTTNSPVICEPIEPAASIGSSTAIADSSEMSCTPPDLDETPKDGQKDLLPGKSKKRYEHAYELFTDWQTLKNTTSVGEDVILEYFQEYTAKHKPSTAWAQYSMLRAVIFANKDVDISEYKKLKAHLRKVCVGFSSKKAPLFASDQLQKFLDEAPNFQYLVAKVIAIFGVAGVTSSKDLVNLTTDDIVHHGNVTTITVRDSQKSSTIKGRYADIVLEYEAHRPANVSKRYFFSYRNGMCTKQTIGINQFAKFPKKIATYLNLPEPELYTLFSFRRTSTRDAEAFIEDSGSNERNIITVLSKTINLGLPPAKYFAPDTLSAEPLAVCEPKESKEELLLRRHSTVTVTSCAEEATGSETPQTCCIDDSIDNMRKIISAISTAADSLSSECFPPDATPLEPPVVCEPADTELELKAEQKPFVTVTSSTAAPSASDTSQISSTPADFEETPPTEIPKDVLPDKSKRRYEYAYQIFTEWQTSRNTTSVCEDVVLSYFEEYTAKHKPSTAWSHYSMLRAVISVSKNVDISEYKKLKAHLKKVCVGFSSKKAPRFAHEQIQKFLDDAPDLQHLATKVIAIFGMSGATRNKDLVNLRTEDVEHHGQVIIVRVPGRSCMIEGKPAEIIRKYEGLRPRDVCTNRFFVNYQNGKCTKQVIGINKIGRVPKKIATFLKLPEANEYTAHSFRHMQATVAKGYTGNSVNNKRKSGYVPSTTKTIETSASEQIPTISSSSDESEPETPTKQKPTVTIVRLNRR